MTETDKKTIMRIKDISKQLDSALKKLEEALDLVPREINKDATIQRFEFSFELSWKLLKFLARLKGVEVASPRDSIRAGVQNGFINNAEKWFEYLEARNWTSHTYDKVMAESVYKKSRSFLPYGKELSENTHNIISGEK